MIPQKIVLVGTGNVASHLAGALGRKLTAIVGRDTGKACMLAQKNGIPFSGDTSVIRDIKPDMLILSIADNALPSVAAGIGQLPGTPLTVHTSGTIAKEVLDTISPRTGVLYPLQTFSKDVYVDMHSVPFFTEAASPGDLAAIDSLARSISGTVHHADAASRQLLHIAGVFSSNFVNILLEIVGDILGQGNYPLSTVRPLVEATVAKAFEAGPHNAQTGPARRGDKSVIDKHIAALPHDKGQIYRLLSEYIINSHKVSLK